MTERLPLDGEALAREWWDSDYELYRPQGYKGYECSDREWEMYAVAVIDFDLYVYYCFSVRHRPYLANPVTVDGRTPEFMEERRDHLFVELPILKSHPDQTEPEFRVAWMGDAHKPFSEHAGTYRDVMAAFMDFIDEGRDASEPI